VKPSTAGPVLFFALALPFFMLPASAGSAEDSATVTPGGLVASEASVASDASGAAVSPMASIAAPEADCAMTSRIIESFSNGARWEMCLESRGLENLVLKHVTYITPAGNAVPVLASASLAQLHVAYDDSDITYNDVTEYGLGGGSLIQLDESDCPYGTIVDMQGMPTLCRWRRAGGEGYRSATRAVETESLNLFSVSQIGAYAYIQSWAFHDDGAIEPGIGATGALQRASADTTQPFGRVLAGDTENLWLSHTHNYYWRLDFDIGRFANDDVVIETRFPQATNGRRTPELESFETEAARLIEPALLQSWLITEEAGSTLGYRIEPLRNGHHFERTEIEPYTAFDIFVTRARDCERFASQNARFNPECPNDVLEFANAESLANEDIVFWHRVGFHHVPRNEDQRHMHAHWDGFVMEPVGLHARTPGTAETTNSPPSLVPPVARTGTLGETLASEQFQASDADSDNLWFEAIDLPDGLSLSPTGVLAGSFDSAGDYAVTLRVDDGQSLAESSFTWRVIDPADPNAGTADGAAGSTTAAATSDEGSRRSGRGAASAQMLLILLLLLLRPQCLERIARQEPSPLPRSRSFARMAIGPRSLPAICSASVPA